MRSGERRRVLAVMHWDGGTVEMDGDGSAIPFGRASECPIQLGVSPEADPGVPAVAGRLVAVDDRRVAVENLTARLALDVHAPGHPLDAVRPGALYSPDARHFSVRVPGSRGAHSFRVELAAQVEGPAPDGGDPDPPALTARQWQVLGGYVRPILDGGPVPATHAEVAAALGWSMALIRVECSQIWHRLVAAGIPMRDFPDKRDAVVDAALRHRLLPEPSGRRR